MLALIAAPTGGGTVPELVWDGKYDASGKRIAPLRVSLPFQTVETVNESAQERQRSLDLFAGGRDPEWRNRLLWGDKKYVLPALLDEFAGQVELVYIDPPFATGADFSLTHTVPESDAGFTKQPSVIEQKAYRDTWGRGLDSYLQWVYESVILLQDFLTETGSIYVHIGPNVNHLVRACLDEVFGAENFRSQIVWKRTTAHSDAVQVGVCTGEFTMSSSSTHGATSGPGISSTCPTTKRRPEQVSVHRRRDRAAVRPLGYDRSRWCSQGEPSV